MKTLYRHAQATIRYSTTRLVTQCIQAPSKFPEKQNTDIRYLVLSISIDGPESISTCNTGEFGQFTYLFARFRLVLTNLLTLWFISTENSAQIRNQRPRFA